MTSEYQRLRRQQMVREAEGYIDLLLLCADQWALTVAVRNRVAQRALEVLERLDRRSRRQAHVLYLKGQALRVMERYLDALQPLREAAEHDPDNIHIWLALGWCYKRCGRLDLAIQALEDGLSVGGSEAILYYNLACYWSLANNTKLALAYLSRALDIDPEFRELIGEEHDFDPIRRHPDFQALTSLIV